MTIKCKVYVQGGKKCIKCFDSIRDAQEWCWTRNTGKSYVIEFKYPEEHDPRYIYL